MRNPELQVSELPRGKHIPVLVAQPDSMGTDAPVQETLIDFTYGSPASCSFASFIICFPISRCM